MRKPGKVARLRSLRRSLLLLAVSAVLVLNGIAWMQAWAMTHYSQGGERTLRPEDMSALQRGWTLVTGVNVPRPLNHLTPAGAGLEYQVRRIGIPGSGGQELEAWYVPARQAHGMVLMFPGYAASKEAVLPAAAAIHDLGYDALMVDFRGAGGSSGQDTTLGIREGTDVAISVRYAQDTWPGRPLVVYGVSMGAAAVLRAVAREGIKPDALMLESPFDSLLGTVGNRFRTMGLPAFPSAELLVFWGSVQQGFNGFEHNPVDYARSVQCPTLLLHGDQDPRATPAQARVVFDNLGGRKEFVTFPGAIHQPLVTYDPALWKAKVAGFLAALGK